MSDDGAFPLFDLLDELLDQTSRLPPRPQDGEPTHAGWLCCGAVWVEVLWGSAAECERYCRDLWERDGGEWWDGYRVREIGRSPRQEEVTVE